VQVPATNELVSFDLHELSGPPAVPVYVNCDPIDDNQRAVFSCKRGTVEVASRAADAIDPSRPTAAWEVELVYGTYDFEATIAAARHRLSDVTVAPPVKRVTLKDRT
jgi:hypothetical protein